MDSHRLFLENLDKNGLLQQKGKAAFAENNNNNFFASTPNLSSFGHLTVNSVKPKTISPEYSDIEELSGETFDGFDTDILSNSKFKKIDDKQLKLKVKIAKLEAELEEHKKLVESSFLKSDKNHYQKLLEIQYKMESELQRLVAEYQNRQLKSIIFSPFVKLIHFIKDYIALK